MRRSASPWTFQPAEEKYNHGIPKHQRVRRDRNGDRDGSKTVDIGRLMYRENSVVFAPRAERPQARERREARAFQLCSKCPVAKECRESARENHEYGYWGGENEEDRYLAGYTVAAPIGIRTRLPRIA